MEPEGGAELGGCLWGFQVKGKEPLIYSGITSSPEKTWEARITGGDKEDQLPSLR